MRKDYWELVDERSNRLDKYLLQFLTKYQLVYANQLFRQVLLVHLVYILATIEEQPNSKTLLQLIKSIPELDDTTMHESPYLWWACTACIRVDNCSCTSNIECEFCKILMSKMQ